MDDSDFEDDEDEVLVYRRPNSNNNNRSLDASSRVVVYATAERVASTNSDISNQSQSQSSQSSQPSQQQSNRSKLGIPLASSAPIQPGAGAYFFDERGYPINRQQQRSDDDDSHAFYLSPTFSSSSSSASATGGTGSTPSAASVLRSGGLGGIAAAAATAVNGGRRTDGEGEQLIPLVVVRTNRCNECGGTTSQARFNWLGIAMAVVLFPFGLVCCLASKHRVCSRCKAPWPV